jgi:hypothetical protein
VKLGVPALTELDNTAVVFDAVVECRATLPGHTKRLAHGIRVWFRLLVAGLYHNQKHANLALDAWILWKEHER